MDVLTTLKRAGSAVGDRLVGSPRALPRWALAALVANAGIIVTGAIVRLTGSGLGCPTWPRCTDESYVPHGEITHHALIEFGNRLLTFVLIIVAIMAFWAAVRHGARQHKLLLFLCGIGVPLQGVIGGITVLTDLNPFVVALHLLLSLVLVVVLTRVVMSTWPARTDEVHGPARWLATGTFVAMMVVCWLGTVVTGSGPHSGDGGAVRTGFDIELVAKLHAGSVWAAVLLTVASVIVLRRGGHRHAARWAMLLLAVELAQGAVGYAQFFTGLPVALVIVHMLGAALSASAAAAVMFGVRSLPAMPTRAAQKISGSTAMAANSSAR